MELKKYQNRTLDCLRAYLERARIEGPQKAYEELTNAPELMQRLGGLLGYKPLRGLENVPRVCLKIPTGGGKTILAAHSLKIFGDTWCNCENPVCLWFTPSDTIRKQTVEALKNPRHPYRKVLDEAFAGKVQVFDLDEKFNIRLADLEQNLCIIVSTMQSFSKEDTAKYNVYKHNENLEPHFAAISPEDGMERDEQGKIKYSFANLLYHYRPVVIVDEAHKAVTELTKKVHLRINPCAILELTATPHTNNNTLYNVEALELKDEEMIKLPVVLEACRDWEEAVQWSVIQQKYLEKQASGETEYIRPLVLIQAQSHQKGDETRMTPDRVREYLIQVHGVPETQISIATGDQKELDAVDVFDKNCPVRFIITIEALKEGWDCSFAYILCSLTNIKSSTAIQQLLGRVLRMPFAKKRQVPCLNKAYAYVCSPSFTTAADDIVQCLRECGFDERVAPACVDQVDPAELLKGLGYCGTGIVLTPEEASQVQETDNVRIEDEGEGRKRVWVTMYATEGEVNRFAEKLPPAKKEVARRFASSLRPPQPPKPHEPREPFRVPRLMVALQGELIPADTDDMVEAFAWNLVDYATKEIKPSEITQDTHGTTVQIDIEGNRLIVGGYDMGEQGFLSLGEAVPDGWTQPALVCWLDQKLRQSDINQTQMVKWLSRVVHDLMVVKGLTIGQLMNAKYSLAQVLRERIRKAREDMRNSVYQRCLFGQDARVELDFDNGFEFRDDMYADAIPYTGNYRFQKHFLPRIPAFDGKEDGEEIECAKILDSLDEVKYWIRNIALDPASFSLPTASGRFYPDFIALLNDGRIFVLEYKGANLLTNEDTAEKETIGKLWENHSCGKSLFMIANGSRDPGFRNKLREKIGR